MRKSGRNELTNGDARRAMRRREARENRIGLERAVLDQPQSTIQRLPRRLVILVPGGECGNDDAGVGAAAFFASIIPAAMPST